MIKETITAARLVELIDHEMEHGDNFKEFFTEINLDRMTIKFPFRNHHDIYVCAQFHEDLSTINIRRKGKIYAHASNWMHMPRIKMKILDAFNPDDEISISLWAMKIPNMCSFLFTNTHGRSSFILRKVFTVTT